MNLPPETETSPLLPKWSHAIWLVRVITIATVLVEGYDVGVTSGALPLLRKELNFTKSGEAVWVSIIFAGMVIGAPFGSYLADLSGRKVALGFIYVLLISGPLFMAVAVGYRLSLIGRLLEGIAVGAGLSVVSTYLAEIAPAAERGRLVGLEELCLVGGSALGSFSAFSFYGFPGDWRLMLALGSIPPLGLGLVMILCDVPESPRWLHAQGYAAEAEAALTAYVGPLEATRTLKLWEQSQKEVAPWSKVLMPETAQKRENLISGLVVATVNGAGGIQVLVVYLGSFILDEVHHDRVGYTYLALFGLFRVVLVLCTLTYLSDKMSRRYMFLLSTTGTTLSCAMIATAYATNQNFLPWKFAAFACFASSHAFGNGPATWPYLGEVCSTDVRSKSVSLFLLCSRAVMGICMACFPAAQVSIGPAGIFIGFFSVNALGWCLMYHYVRDVQGLTLEEANEVDMEVALAF